MAGRGLTGRLRASEAPDGAFGKASHSLQRGLDVTEARLEQTQNELAWERNTAKAASTLTLATLQVPELNVSPRKIGKECSRTSQGTTTALQAS